MIRTCTLTQLRDNLGRYVKSAEVDGRRFVILSNGREAAGLVPLRDALLLENALSRSMDYKAVQIAEEMMRWRIVRQGVEELQRGDALPTGQAAGSGHTGKA